MARSRAGTKRARSEPTKPKYRFSSPDASFSLKSGVVRLSFPSAPDKPSLYSHAAVLSCWSNVLAGLLEGADPSGAVALGNGAAAAGAAGQQPGGNQELLIELQDEDTTAWEEALGFMHPKVPLQQVTGENAQRLLLLADKYHMPVLTEMVISYLQQNTEDGESRLHGELLDSDTATQWLVTFSRCGLDELVAEVQELIVDDQVRLGEEEATAVRQEHLVQLLNRVQDARSNTAAGLTAALKQRSQLQESNRQLQAEFDTLQKRYEACQGELQRSRAGRYY